MAILILSLAVRYDSLEDDSLEEVDRSYLFTVIVRHCKNTAAKAVDCCFFFFKKKNVII